MPQLVAKMASESEREREAALLSLCEHPAENVLGPVADLLLENSSDRAQATCLDLLERLGAVVSLADVRADGWFEQFGRQIKQFERICDIIGERFLAYSIILGIQLQSLMTDPRFPANTSVEFTLEDDQIQTLPLGEFRIRVVQAVIRNTRAKVEPRLPLTVQDAAAIVGGRNLLLAPLFDISVEQLVLAGLDPENPRALVGYISPEGFSFIDLRDFDELVRSRVRRDLAGAGEEPFKLDLSAVDVAREAYEAGDFDKVVSVLETWPGLLSILLRTPVMRSLEEEKRLAIAEGLEMLGVAFETHARESWSEELYKLGLQFMREGAVAGRLYLRLGRLLMENARYGEAIGVLRRAQALGIPDPEVVPDLARAFLKRDCLIAAAALLERAAGALGLEDRCREDLADVRKKLDDAGVSWRTLAGLSDNP